MDAALSQIDAESADLIDEALQAVREHFGMPVAYLSRFEGDRSVYRNVSAPGLENLIKPGDSRALQEVYCPHIVSGKLPNLIPDTGLEPICVSMPITAAVPIGSHVSLPIVMPDGEVYGMFCCLSPEPNPTLNDRDLAVMANFASLVTRQVQSDEAQRRDIQDRLAWAEDVLAERRFHPVFQPLVQLADRRPVGAEALCRFDQTVGYGTEEVFLRMAAAGLGLDLEIVTLSSALDAAAAMPPGLYLSVNASPELVCDPRFAETINASTVTSLVVEITEHSLVEDETELQQHVGNLRGNGVRIAIDDVGAGYSGLQRIARLSPDILKIDRSIVAGIDQKLSQRAVVAALVHFASETEASVLVEGVETESEAKTLLALGVDLAQGWLFGRPLPMDQLQVAFRSDAAE